MIEIIRTSAGAVLQTAPKYFSPEKTGLFPKKRRRFSFSILTIK
jgi:hypothetical protein